MYTTINFKSKKQLKEAIERGDKVSIFQPGPFGGSNPDSGNYVLEGPHFPASHSWYAQATIQGGFITTIK